MKLIAVAKLMTFKTDREDSEVEAHVEIDAGLKFKAMLHLSDLTGMLDTHCVALLEGVHDADGNLRTHAFGQIHISGKATGVSATFSSDLNGSTEVKFSEAEVDGITLELQGQRQVELEFKVKTDASDTQVAALASMIKHGVKVELWSRQAELEFGTGAAPKAKAPETEEVEA